MNLSTWLISLSTIFFSHNKSANNTFQPIFSANYELFLCHACSDKHLFREEELATALHSKSNHSSQKSQTRLTSDRCSNSMIRRATDFHLPLKKKIAVNYRACTRFIHQRYHLTHTTTVQHLGSLNFSLSNDQIKCIALYKRSLDYGSLFKRTTSV